MYAKNLGINSNNSIPLIGETNTTTPELEYSLISEDILYQLVSDGFSDSCIYYYTILDNPIDGYKFNDNDTLDVLDFTFPCEESLIQPIIDLCVKEIAAINGIHRDVTNNATDDISLPKQ